MELDEDFLTAPGGEASIAGGQGRGPGMQGLPPVGGEGFQNPDPAQRHHYCPGGGKEGRPGGSGGAIRGGPPRTPRGGH